MAVIKGDILLNALSNDTKKTQRVWQYYIDNLVQRIFKEMLRGNQVSIERFGTFKPKFVGGYEKTVYGKKTWIEPRIGIEFSMTPSGASLLNNKILDPKTRQRMKNGNLFEYERDLLKIKQERKKRDLSEVFFEVIGGNDDDEIESEEEINGYEEEDNEI